MTKYGFLCCYWSKNQKREKDRPSSIYLEDKRLEYPAVPLVLTPSEASESGIECPFPSPPKFGKSANSTPVNHSPVKGGSSTPNGGLQDELRKKLSNRLSKIERIENGEEKAFEKCDLEISPRSYVEKTPTKSTVSSDQDEVFVLDDDEIPSRDNSLFGSCDDTVIEKPVFVKPETPVKETSSDLTRSDSVGDNFDAEPEKALENLFHRNASPAKDNLSPLSKFFFGFSKLIPVCFFCPVIMVRKNLNYDFN